MVFQFLGLSVDPIFDLVPFDVREHGEYSVERVANGFIMSIEKFILADLIPEHVAACSVSCEDHGRGSSKTSPVWWWIVGHISGKWVVGWFLGVVWLMRGWLSFNGFKWECWSDCKLTVFVELLGRGGLVFRVFYWWLVI